MDHMKRFKDLVYDIKANGVLDDYLLCKLFKYSLVYDTSYWLKQLPPRSLTSWKAIKYTFMRNFFDDARSEDLRNIISMFTQGLYSLLIANGLDSDHIRGIVHEVQLLGTFFRGLALVYQMALDKTSDGNFNTKNPEKVVRLIKNLASNNNTKTFNYERKKSGDSLDKEQMVEVKEKLNNVQKLLKKQVTFAEDVEAVEVASDRADEEGENSQFHHELDVSIVFIHELWIKPKAP